MIALTSAAVGVKTITADKYCAAIIGASYI